MAFELTLAEVRRICKGDPRPLVRDEDPRLDQGQVIVLKVFEERAIGDKHTGRLVIPEEPSVWITITSVVRTTKGHWSVRYAITDRRDIDTPGHFMRRGYGRTTDPRLSIDPEAPLPEGEVFGMAVWERQRKALEQTLQAVKDQHGRKAETELRVIRRRIEALDRKLRRAA